MLSQLAPQGREERARVEEAGQAGAVFEAGDLARGSDVVFAASGVTSSQVLAGVRDHRGRPQVESIVVTPALGLVRMWTIAGAGPGG